MSVEVRAENTTSLASVKAIYDATRRAKASADEAEQHAQEALASASEASRQAGLAQDSADEAKESADKANRQAIYATNYANNALTQLGTVESVVDTLSWITDHSAFVSTADTSVVSGKTYYLPCNNVLTIADGTTTTNGLTFTMKDNMVTVNGTATADTTVSVGVPSGNAGDTIYISGITGGSASTYMLRYAGGGSTINLYDGVQKTTKVSGAGETLRIVVLNGTVMDEVVFTPTVSTANEDFEYTIVDNPTGNPLTQGYFELDTDEAVKTYVKAHLSLTNDGLYILNDASAYKMLLANNGMYIQAPNGTTVNQSTADGNIIRATDGTVIAHLGYGEGTAQSGTATAPYYTLGTRVWSAPNYNANNTYAIGDVCTYNNQLYVCGNDITTPEAWTPAHWKTPLVGNYSVVEGYENVGAGWLSHAEGDNTRAIGSSAHAEGTQTVASGINSHAQNEGTLANYPNQTAIGSYNKCNDTAFEIGNGSDTTSRSNAFEVDWSGNVNIPSGANYKINGAEFAVKLADKYTRSSAGDLEWTSTADGNQKVVAKSALAFWNGAYSGSSSNLSKCSTGNIIGSNGGTMTGQLLTSYKSSVAMGSYGSAQTTVPNLVNEVRYSSGCMGSASINTAYTNGVTIPTGWYNFIYTPHRSGGNSGSASGDNCNYGNLELFSMTMAGGRYVIRVAGGAIAEVVRTLDVSQFSRTDEGWSYRKYSNGQVDAWYKASSFGTVAFNTSQQGGKLYTNADWISKSIDLPSGLFAYAPIVTVNITNNGYLISQVASVSTTAVVVRAFSLYTGNYNIGELMIHAHGAY